MTDAERLKVAEELIHALTPYDVSLCDMNIRWGGTLWHAFKKPSGFVSEIAKGGTLLECVILARQKLAQEAEAAMTPRERKMRDRVTRIRNYVQKGGEWDKAIIKLCDEALEDS